MSSFVEQLRLRQEQKSQQQQKFVSTSLRLAPNAVKSYPPPDRIYDKTDLGRAYLESPEQFQQFRSVKMEQIKQTLDEKR
jgi:hypothetical protein